jgi:hypothetical protein
MGTFESESKRKIISNPVTGINLFFLAKLKLRLLTRGVTQKRQKAQNEAEIWPVILGPRTRLG